MVRFEASLFFKCDWYAVTFDNKTIYLIFRYIINPEKKKLLNFISVGESSCGLMIIPDIDNLPDANVKTMQL